MFIIHGAYDVDRPRGVVAERCNRCGEVTLFELTQRYKVSHLYFIPLGSGELQETVLACGRCGTRAVTSVAHYVQVIPEKRARSMSLGDIVEATNPRLAQLLVHVSEFEGAGDPRVQAACDALWEVGPHHPATNHFLERLALWTSLDASKQERLLSEIDAWRQREQRRHGRLQFLRSIATSFKKDADPGLAFLTFFAVVVAGLGVVLGLVSDAALCAIGIVGTFVAATVGAIWVHRRWRRRMYRQFVKRLAPQAQARAIDLSALMKDLKAVRLKDPEESPDVKAMAKRRRTLLQLLEEEGLLTAETSEDAGVGEYADDPLIFLQEMARDFPTAVDGFLPFLALALVAVAGLIASAANLEGALLAAGLVGALVAGVVAAVVVQRWVRNRQHRRFFRRTLLPEAEERGIDARRLVEALESVDVADSAVEHPLHAMARALPILRDAVRKQQLLSGVDVGRR